MSRASSPLARLRGAAGQATTEYVALLAVVGLVVVGGVAATVAFAPGVAATVLAHVRHALCIVAGGCRSDLRPCVTSSRGDDRHGRFDLEVLRVGAHQLVLREWLSDGRLRLTVLSGEQVGAGFEADGALRIGEHDVGASASAVLVALAAKGRVFHVRSEDEAQRVLERVRRASRGPRRPGIAGVHARGRLDRELDPDEVWDEGGVGATGTLEGGVGQGAGEADLQAEGALGVHRNRRTGTRTVFLRAAGSGTALLEAVLGQGARAAAGQTVVGVTLDRRGRPVELSLRTSGRGVGDLPPLLAARLGTTPERGGTRRRWELDARAPLSDPAVADALAVWRRAPGDVTAARALGAALAERAALDARVYDVRRSEEGTAAGVSVGPHGVGVSVRRVRERAVLVTAASRPAGGLWEPRRDCVRPS
ncbi:MAG: hypothetical protein M3P39_01385 [Actinomycetota bacterium]|nr:hypothetical protein [Actinomycetota bacterium]